MGTIGWPELLIILLVVLLVFGVGRIARVGGELGKGVAAFRDGLKEGQKSGDEEARKKSDSTDDPAA
ncbi:MAG: twin-arginine translocase TatA/TatE family subunit [Anaerolineae bacterium]|nr:twin-arginine translocase TatA/TatE family subunit [Promineifilum sp.]MCZ2114002.1 twin-arginine translocase TatA/TatE family subunit [Anaerolineae bacterium]HNS39842.1 twin-arginine translocase TatA/TatE family subunit [Promineifilum sp.]